jgi:ribosomal protein L10
MQRQEKEKYAQEVLALLKKEESLFVLSHTNFTAEQWIALRHEIKKNTGSVIVIKKKLARIVFDQLNYIHLIEKKHKGHVFIVTAGSKFFNILNILKRFSETKEKKICLLGGVLEKNELNQESLEMVKNMTSIKDIHTLLIRVLLESPMRLTRLLNAVVKKKEAS